MISKYRRYESKRVRVGRFVHNYGEENEGD